MALCASASSTKRRRVVVRVATEQEQQEQQQQVEAQSSSQQEHEIDDRAAQPESSVASGAKASALARPVTELSRLPDADLDAMWGTVARRAVQRHHARTEEESAQLISVFSNSAASAAAAVSAAGSASGAQDLDDAAPLYHRGQYRQTAEEEALERERNAEDRLCVVAIGHSVSAAASGLLVSAADLRRQVVDEVMDQRRRQREERDAQRAERQRQLDARRAAKEERVKRKREAEAHQKRQRMAALFAARSQLQGAGGGAMLSAGFQPFYAPNAAAAPEQAPPSTGAEAVAPVQVDTSGWDPAVAPSLRQQQQHQQPRASSAGSFGRKPPQRQQPRQEQQQPRAVIRDAGPLRRKDPLDSLLDAIAANDGHSAPPAGSSRGSATGSGVRRVGATGINDADAAWGVIPAAAPKQETARRFASTGGGFRRIDAPRSKSTAGRIVIGGSAAAKSSGATAATASGSKIVLGAKAPASAAASSGSNTILSPATATATPRRRVVTLASSASAPAATASTASTVTPTAASRLAPPQRRERSDEVACLAMVLERVFAGLSRDGERLPVSQCIAYFFDAPTAAPAPATASTAELAAQTSNSNSGGGGVGSSSAVRESDLMSLGEICDHFDAVTTKRIQDVPVAVRRAVRARLQRGGSGNAAAAVAAYGGPLKFIETHMQGRLEVHKDKTTGELVIRRTASAAQQHASTAAAAAARLAKQQKHLPTWAWNAAHNAVTSFQLPAEQQPAVADSSSPASLWSMAGAASTHAVADASGSGGSASSSSRPWSGHDSARQSLEHVRFSERLPLAHDEVLAMMDMFAAGTRPIYGAANGEQWTFSAVANGAPSTARVWRASEVANVFVHHVPTFWVKEKQLAKAITMAVPDILGEMKLDVEDLFERYSPQVFEIHWGEPNKDLLEKLQQQRQLQENDDPTGRSRKSPASAASLPFYMLKNRDVRLSPFLVHPERGAADAKWQLRASDIVAEESQLAQDRKFAEVLLANLPEDGLFVHLPTWINTGLSPQDFHLVNSAPPQRVLTVLHQYSSHFYIRADVPPKIQCVTEHFVKAAAEAEASMAAAGGSAVEGSAMSKKIDIWVRRRPTHLAPRCIDEHDAESSPAPELAQFLLEALVDHEDRAFAALAGTTNSSTKKASSSLLDDDAASDQFVDLPLPENAPRIAADETGGAGDDDDEGGPAAPAAAAGTVRCVVAKLHAASSSAATVGGSAASLAVWVPVAHLYRLLSRPQKDALRPYSTLAKFLRMHGRIFCVSQDLQRVALHRWDGASQAFATVDTLLAEEENMMVSGTAGSAASTATAANNMEGVTPRTRKQLQHLAPDHPLLNPATLLQAVYDALPPDRSVLVRDVFHRLPREARAALPARAPYRVLLQAPHMLTVWRAHVGIGGGGKRQLMVQRAELGPPPPGCGLHECATREEIVAHVQELLAMHQCYGGGSTDGGGGAGSDHDVLLAAAAAEMGGKGGKLTLQRLHEQLRWDAVVGVRQHFGGLEACIKAFPALFSLERDPNAPDNNLLQRVALRT